MTLIGDFEIITDREIKQDVWVDWFIQHYPGGVDDPIYFVAKFVTKRVSLWIDREYAAFDISQINEPQSRCGLLCAGCCFKDSHGCGGLRRNRRPSVPWRVPDSRLRAGKRIYPLRAVPGHAMR